MYGDDGLVGKQWLLHGGPADELDAELGLRRARAATLLMLALPGSAYLYQGEELGLPEVADIPDADRQDPTFFHSPGVEVGRDGCRVPLPWAEAGSSYGFGGDGAHLPQPAWWGEFSVAAENADPDSTLNMYRRALELRHELQDAEGLLWRDHPAGSDVLWFARPGGWQSITLLRALWACRRRGIPALYRGDSHRGSGPHDWRRPLWALRTWALLRGFSGYLSVGKRAREYLRSFGVPSARIFASPHAVDNTYFAATAAPHQDVAARARARAAHGFGPDDFVVLFVGKIEAKKRQEDIIAAVAALAGLALPPLSSKAAITTSLA